jgi:hypothetical protein
VTGSPGQHRNPERGSIAILVFDDGQHELAAALAEDHVACIEETLPTVRRIGLPRVHPIGQLVSEIQL